MSFKVFWLFPVVFIPHRIHTSGATSPFESLLPLVLSTPVRHAHMDDDDDFDDLFAAFNEDPDIALLSENISDNLREQAGIGGNTVVHEGEADEGRVTWVAPAVSGLNVTQAAAAAASMSSDELAGTAEVFDKLAAHGKGFAVIDAQEFKTLLLKLADDEAGKQLLKQLMTKASGKQ